MSENKMDEPRLRHCTYCGESEINTELKACETCGVDFCTECESHREDDAPADFCPDCCDRKGG